MTPAVSHDLQNADGEVCALGCALRAKGIDPTTHDPYEHGALGAALDIAEPMVREIENENDERGVTPEQRWTQMRAWVARRIKP